jgi:hypothetical protein
MLSAMSFLKRISRLTWAAFGVTLAVLLIAYLPLMQRIPNGADHYFMVDVGETQIVLNNWGTLHATGYPHYVILGNLMTAPMRWMGLAPLDAAAWVSLLWGLVAAGLTFALAYHLTKNASLAATVTTLYGLTRTVWVHHLIAEIYTFGMVIIIGLFALALWRGEVGGWNDSPYARIYWLALLGGIGVAHHRATGMAAPALLFAVWPILMHAPRKLPIVLTKTLLLGLAGFIPYGYLTLRARMGADWVYGDPETWGGLWYQFIGAEGTRYMGLPDNTAAFTANLTTINDVLLIDLTLTGIVLGVAGLIAGMISLRYRRAAITMTLSGAVAYGFHVVYYTDVLSALILSVTLSVAFGWLFGVDLLLRATWAHGFPTVPGHQRIMWAGLLVSWAVFSVVLSNRNVQFLRDLVTDSRGIQAIETVKGAPNGSVVMIPWGPQHFAVGYALDISGDLDGMTLVDHNADYHEAAEDGTLITPEYVRHRYPLDWWEAQIGAELHPQVIAPGLVALQTEADRLAEVPLYIDVLASQEQVVCRDDHLALEVTWLAPASPQQDVSVFVHLLDMDGNLLAQDDRFAPVYGWRPVSTWEPGELVHDLYTLPRDERAATVRYGLYEQAADGTFNNLFEHELEVDCGA